MVKCAQCGAETNLYVNSQLLCVQCDEKVSERQREREPRHEPRKRATGQ